MSLRRLTLLGMLVLFAVVAGRTMLLVYRHLVRYGHLTTLGMHADVIVHEADIGIPGVTKMYEAEITNLGLLPISLAQCDFVDDTFSHGTMVAYRIERWDDARNRWTSAVDFSGPEFCKPYPLGIVSASLTMKWLWPGQSLKTGEEATAARSGLKKGDWLRFVVYLTTGDSRPKVVHTAAFSLDESPTDSAGELRVRH